MSDVQLGMLLLASQTISGLVSLFWYVLIFDVPRYVLPFVALAFTGVRRKAEDEGRARAAAPLSVSIIIVGHNEAGSIRACVRSLREQSIGGFEIVIVSDGSSDAMASVSAEIVRRGEAKCIVSTRARGGKASGINLALQLRLAPTSS